VSRVSFRRINRKAASKTQKQERKGGRGKVQASKFDDVVEVEGYLLEWGFKIG
jgi:hypothetical protein